MDVVGLDWRNLVFFFSVFLIIISFITVIAGSVILVRHMLDRRKEQKHTERGQEKPDESA